MGSKRVAITDSIRDSLNKLTYVTDQLGHCFSSQTESSRVLSYFEQLQGVNCFGNWSPFPQVKPGLDRTVIKQPFISTIDPIFFFSMFAPRSSKAKSIPNKLHYLAILGNVQKVQMKALFLIAFSLYIYIFFNFKMRILCTDHAFPKSLPGNCNPDCSPAVKSEP